MKPLFATFAIMFALSACGLKGDLKRPSEAREEEKPVMNAPQPAPYYYQRQQPYGSL